MKLSIRLSIQPARYRSDNEQSAAHVVGSATYDTSALVRAARVTPEKIDPLAPAPRVARFLRRRRRMALRQEVRR